MKRFYIGSISLNEPTATGFPTFETHAEAVMYARKLVIEGGKPRYIVQVVTLVEPQPPPIKITRIRA